MFVKRTMNKIMILKGGNPAIHKLGNIGREKDSYIRVYAEDEDNYIGMFEEGFGFADVRFKKSDCRKLTQNEVEKLNGMIVTINNTPAYEIKIDNDGNLISN